MLRSSLLCLRGTSTYLQPSSSSSSFVVRRQLSKESVDQKITQKLKEYKQKANFQPQKFDPLPCIDATKLVAEPPKKPKGQKKVKVHRKKLRFVKNGMDKIQPYWIPSPNSPIYSIVVETRNMFEYARREKLQHAGATEQIEAPVQEQVQEDVDIRKYLSQPDYVMSKKEAKQAAKGKKK